jgi:5-aminolevulinate synthase
MDYARFFEEQISGLKAEGRYRVFTEIMRRVSHFPEAAHYTSRGTHDIVVWCSNDYLGMGQHPAVLAAMHEAIDLCGAGAGGTRNISGNNRFHVLLEEEIASLHDAEAALLFSAATPQHDDADDPSGEQFPAASSSRLAEPQLDDRGHPHPRAAHGLPPQRRGAT